MSLRLVWFFAAAIALSPTVASAQTVDVGNPFTVNSYTTAVQALPQGCAAADGSFVVTWGEPGSYRYGPEGRNDSGLFGRRISAGGVPVGADFQANTYTSGSQATPTPACLSGGRFVVVHNDSTTYSYYTGTESGRNGLFATMFDGDGTAVGTEFQIDDTAPYAQPPALHAACKNGNDEFVVVWSGASYGLHLRRFDSDGQALGTTVDIDTNYQAVFGPDCCGGSSGFVVAWSANSGNYYQQYLYGEVQAQRFSSSAVPVGTQFQVNTDTVLDQGDPSIGCNDDGEFVVAWRSGSYGYYSPAPPPDGFGTGVFAQRFADTGASEGTEFLVNTGTGANEAQPDVAMSADGEFLVVWHLRNFGGTTVRGQVFDSSGMTLGTELGVIGGEQKADPVALAPPDGPFLMAWQDFKLGVDNDDIRGQLVSLDGVVTTTTTTTTTVTMPGGGVCGDPIDPGPGVSVAVPAQPGGDGKVVTASDALFALKAAVGSESCALCVCDVDNSGSISASDALRILGFAVSQPISLTCPACS
jgi:hypothetical protein